MTDLTSQLRQLRARRRHTLEILGGLSEQLLERPASWRGQTADVRYLLLRLAEGDDERRATLGEIAAAFGWQQSEAQRILARAAETRGQLRAALVGLPDDYLDRVPGSGEWPIRLVLEHLRNVEERYLLQTTYAVERLRSPDPLPPRLPEERLPARVAEPTSAGGVADTLASLDAQRAEVCARLAALPAGDLAAPTVWVRWEVDVRFRLHRFAAHERQHMIQVAKAEHAIGFQPGEAQLIFGQAEVARGALEGALLGLPPVLASRAPGGGLPSVEELLGQALADEDAAFQAVASALA